MIREAVILAAGLGSRLKERTAQKPKGFLELGGVPIVEWSVQKLLGAGVERIIIGTGWRREAYEALAAKYRIIETVYNPDFAETGSLRTLICCAERIRHDFFLLESDLIYDSAALFALANDRRADITLVSGPTESGDEVWLSANAEGVLTAANKDRAALASACGELVGISKLSPALLAALRASEETERAAQPKADYESALAASGVVAALKIERLAWQEIDDERHFRRAETETLPRILENERLRAVRREVLLNPGPATTSDAVKYAQVCPDICPRESEFGEVMRWITDELSALVCAAGKADGIETVLFGGSGTAADEVMISSCVPDGAKLLIVDNGAYGARFAQIAASYRLPHEVFQSSGFKPLDVPALKKRLVDGGFTHLAIVYHETTTGLLNPAPEICRFCHERGVTTIVDAVSAFAALPIDMDADCFDFMASTSNKNIQGMAGCAFVFCRKSALERTAAYPMRSYYLNLWDQYAHFKKTGQTRFTPPVQTLYALRQAIIETKVETIAGRMKRYSDCWETLVAAIERLGLRMLVPKEAQSRLITAIIEPDSPRYSFETLHDLSRAHGWTIYPGKLSGASTFRIANIGGIQVEEMRLWTELLARYMETL